MATSTKRSDEELRAAWEARVEAGTFSPGVTLGNLRVMGKSGDTPVAYPCITDLAVLADDEQWAVEAAQRIVTAHQRERGMSLAVVAPGDVNGATPGATFDPHMQSMILMPPFAGG